MKKEFFIYDKSGLDAGRVDDRHQAYQASDHPEAARGENQERGFKLVQLY